MPALGRKIRTIHGANIDDRHECISKAYLILKHAHESTEALLQAFKTVRRARGAEGAATDEE